MQNSLFGQDSKYRIKAKGREEGPGRKWEKKREEIADHFRFGYSFSLYCSPRYLMEEKHEQISKEVVSRQQCGEDVPFGSEEGDQAGCDSGDGPSVPVSLVPVYV